MYVGGLLVLAPPSDGFMHGSKVQGPGFGPAFGAAMDQT